MADGTIIINTKIDQSGFKQGHTTLSQGLGSITKSLKGVAVAAGIAFSATAIVSFGKKSVTAATELSNALIGLRSILEGQGRDFAKAKAFIQDYTEDGLVPATNAITAYKNLATRGYTDPQIAQTLQALKDSASFGRRASLTLGDAVQSATEGLKDENSILVDNAGVTKNVAKMWQDYAKSIGTTANNLTKQQKIQAEVNGILEETRFQTGDAAKIAETYSGQILQLGYSINNLKVALGNTLIPMAKAVLPSINAIVIGFTRVLNLASQVTTALFGQQAKSQNDIADSANNAAAAQDNLAASTKAAAKEAVAAISGFDELNIIQTETATEPIDEATLFGSAGNEIGRDIEVSPIAVEAAEQLKQLLEPTYNSLLKIKDVLVGFTELGDIELAKSLYNDILLPLSNWTFNEGLPGYLDMIANGLEMLRQSIESAKPGFEILWENFLKPVAQWTGGFILDILTLLKDTYNDLADIFTNRSSEMTNILTGIGTVFQVIWEIISPIVDSLGTLILDVLGAALEWIIKLVDNTIQAFSGWIDFIAGIFTGDWDRILKGATNIFEGSMNNIKDSALLVWDIIVAFFDNAWTQIKVTWGYAKSFFKGIWDGIKGIFSGVADWFKDIFTKAWENVKGVFSSGGKIFAGIKEGIADTFKTVVNGLITGINVVVGAPFKTINSLLNKVRDVSFLGISPFSKLWGKDPLPVPQIPKLARGGIVDAPTLALVGERGREAVLPLENNTGWMDKLAEIIASRINAALQRSGGSGDVYVFIGNEQIDARIEKVQNKQNIRSNGKAVLA